MTITSPVNKNLIVVEEGRSYGLLMLKLEGSFMVIQVQFSLVSCFDFIQSLFHALTAEFWSWWFLPMINMGAGLSEFARTPYFLLDSQSFLLFQQLLLSPFSFFVALLYDMISGLVNFNFTLVYFTYYYLLSLVRIGLDFAGHELVYKMEWA